MKRGEKCSQTESLDASHADYLCYHAFAIRRDHDHTAAKDRQLVGYAFKAGTIR